MAPLLLLAGACMLAGTQAQAGPGTGSWTVTTAESQGLSSEALQASADLHFDSMDNRYCFLVVKNGNIVHEEYRNGKTVSSTQPGFSTSKSGCSALFGIAVEQGWADVEDRVRDRNRGTRQCNPDAQFKHVLTMTAFSEDLSDPQYQVDTTGRDCLDTISDFIGENNPENLSATEWKTKYWQEPLGMEHASWGGGFAGLTCGFGQDLSCRDLARSGQLFLNDGAWDGKQLANAEFMQNSRQQTVGDYKYGYAMWLEPEDPVDPSVSWQQGSSGQCVFVSKEHNALIVTMGNDDGGEAGICGNAWEVTRGAIVSNDHPKFTDLQATGALNISRVL